MWYEEEIYEIEELHPMPRYEIVFSTVKPRKTFILRIRTRSRLDKLSEKTLKILLQDWINRTFETPYKVRKIFSLEFY